LYIQLILQFELQFNTTAFI